MYKLTGDIKIFIFEKFTFHMAFSSPVECHKLIYIRIPRNIGKLASFLGSSLARKWRILRFMMWNDFAWPTTLLVILDLVGLSYNELTSK